MHLIEFLRENVPLRHDCRTKIKELVEKVYNKTVVMKNFMNCSHLSEEIDELKAIPDFIFIQQIYSRITIMLKCF